MPKTLQGTFTYPDGTPANGATLYMKLSQDAVALGTSQIAPRIVTITLNSSGQIPGGTSIYANDELTPSGTVYNSSVIAIGGGLVYGPELLSVSGTSPVNLNALVPTDVGGIVISYPNPVLQNPSAAQTISGQPLTIASSAPLTVNSAATFIGVLTFATLVSGTINPAQSGTIRLAVTDSIAWRNNANTGDVLLTINGQNALVAPTGFVVVGEIFSSTALSIGTTIASYNGIFTVSNGVPVEYATVDLTAQTALIGTTTLYAVPATGAGQYRLSWNAKVTTPGSVSSTLGALTIVYTDPDGVVQTITAGALVPAGTVATTNAGNATSTILLGIPLLLNCKLSTNITYAFAYTANSAASMAYNLH